MAIHLLWTFLLTIVLVHTSIAQVGSIENNKLNALYQDFRYQEVIQQAEEILREDPGISIDDKCEILRLLSLSYYSQQDMQGALKNFALILKLDHNYHLDPVENSPKILAFFEEIRRQSEEKSTLPEKQAEGTLAMTVPDINVDSLEQAARLQMALSFILPGSGQIGRGEKTKGWLLVGGNAVLLGTFIYFASESNRLEDEYLQATTPADISAAYDAYNQAYQNRNLALAGFVAIWMYTQIDFLYLSKPQPSSGQFSWYPTMERSGRTSLTIAYQF
jgi:hypothetical protein